MSKSLPPSSLTWMGSERRLATRVAHPLARFLAFDAAAGILLIIATIVALVWANSPWSESYHTFVDTHISINIGSFHIDESIEHWVNDALMVIFFFVVGLEIKSELVNGELRDPRVAALPAMAAIGGMVVPAAIYVALNTSSPEVDGWGIPMATDIAFAIGVVSLLGSRVPSSLKVYLLTLAIVDDIGAIAVIALFYTDDLSVPWLLCGIGLLILVAIMKQMRIWYVPLYIAVGVVVWYAIFESGIHATIAGVALGLLTPASPLRDDDDPRDMVVDYLEPGDVGAAEARRASFYARESVSVSDRLQELLHPFSSYVIVPVFALVNAGIELSSDGFADAVGSSVTIGIVLGLVVGKMVGVTLFTWIAVRGFGLSLPEGADWRQIVGIAVTAGIGFTVSLFITGLAFDDELITSEAKLGILVASFIAAVLGLLILRSGSDEPPPKPDLSPEDEPVFAD